MASPYTTGNGSTLLDVHIVDCESPKSLYSLCEASTPPLTTTTPLTSSSTEDNIYEDDESSGDGLIYACHEYSQQEEAEKEGGLPDKEVCEEDPRRVFTGGDDALAPGCGSCSCCSSNAESVCEGRDFPKDTCLSIGCCQWDGEDEECYSAVGESPCWANPPSSAAVQESENGTVELGSGEYEYEYDYEEGSNFTEEENGADCTGGDSCCSPTNPCSEGAGDCDSDSDCFGDLRCGSNNCQGEGFEESDDCCYREGEQLMM